MKFRLPLFLSIAVLALCQVDRATVTGTLRDPTWAVVANAKITVTYPATGFTRTVSANESGAYPIAGLPVGAVAIQVAKPGFRAIRAEAMLNVGQTRTFDFPPELASVDSSEVVAEADLVRNSAEIGATLQNAFTWGRAKLRSPAGFAPKEEL